MTQPISKAKSINRAILWLAVMTAAWIIYSLYWLAIIIHMEVVQFLPDFYAINAIQPAATCIAALATIFAASHVIRSQICAAKYQRMSYGPSPYSRSLSCSDLY